MPQDKQQKEQRLTLKQRLFVDYYTAAGSDTYNNATQSAIKAGYKDTKSVEATACNLLRLPKIQKAIDAKLAERRKKIEYNYDIAIQQLDMVINNLRPLANRGNVQANQALTAAIREKNAITGLHTQTVKTQDISRPDISDAERQALADLARRYNIKLAAG